MEKFYLTTAIDYVNGAPHIGHAYEKILTDVIARHFKKRCNDLYFLSGTDEHGIKIQKTAASKGITPKELCDNNAKSFTDTWKLLDIDYNKFIRTTDDYHEKAVQLIFKKLVEIPQDTVSPLDDRPLADAHSLGVFPCRRAVEEQGVDEFPVGIL